MITTGSFHMDFERKEELPIETDSMPYYCRYAERNYFIGGQIPWHWHPAFEIDYVLDGEITFFATDCQVTARKGEMVFINTNVLHRASVNKSIRLHAHLFDMHYLSGVHGSSIESRYFSPITGSRSLMLYKIKPDHLSTVQMTEYILRVADYAANEPFGYEFEIRTLLDKFWQIFFLETADIRKKDKPRNNQAEERLKHMLNFIHTNYSDTISLRDIADTAGISERECTRVFRKITDYTPAAYLRHYRIRMAAQLLLETTDSISDISGKCGFHDLSYFSRVFQKETGKTPSAYRKNA